MKGSELLVKRRKVGVRQKQIVARMGIDPRTIRDVENDRLGLSPESFAKWHSAIEAAAKEQIAGRGKTTHA